jgi:hypothetical protein
MLNKAKSKSSYFSNHLGRYNISDNPLSGRGFELCYELEVQRLSSDGDFGALDEPAVEHHHRRIL